MGKICAIVPAAGLSSRMNGIDKLTADIGGEAVLSRSVRALAEYPLITDIVVAGRQDELPHIRGLLSFIEKPLTVIAGGSTRNASVRAALSALPDDCEIVVIHDAARPFISFEVIERVIEAAKKYGGAIAAVPVKDTIKIADGDIIEATPDRSRLWQAQTPQAFSAELYKKASETAPNAVTDDASVFENAGYPVRLVMGDYTNKKITTPEDLPNMSVHFDDIRIGNGYDVHRLVEGRRLVLGGIEISSKLGLLGHSDADVLVHAIMDAMLGALALGDIGRHFPDTDKEYEGISSMLLLEKVSALVFERGYSVSNLDATVIAEKPKLSPYIEKIRENLATALKIDTDRISIKATTEEGLGLAGEGIGAKAVCLLRR